MMKRRENWQQCLNQEIEAARERPFSWGGHDCCVFTASCIKAMTGEDLMERYNGLYSNWAEAREALKQYGNKTLFRTLQKLLGKEIALAKVNRGDVVYRRDGDFPSVGICLGEVSVFVGAKQTANGEVIGEGLVTVPTLSCIKGFKV